MVFDGGSTDDTVEVLRRFPSVRRVSRKDKGQTDAVNQGIRTTDGAIIGLLNQMIRLVGGRSPSRVDSREGRSSSSLSGYPLTKRKLPGQGDTSKVEFLAV